MFNPDQTSPQPSPILGEGRIIMVAHALYFRTKKYPAIVLDYSGVQNTSFRF